LTKVVVVSTFRRAMHLRPGDHIHIHRGAYHHDAIYVGNGRVIHLWAPRGKGAASIRMDSLGAVRGPNGLVTVAEYGVCFDASEVVQRAFSRLGERGYNVFSGNCEHFATWCKTGQHASSQVERASAVIAGSAGSRAAASLGISAVGATGFQGLSGPGIMSGLATIGGTAALGISAVAAVPAAVATVATHRALRDDRHLPEHERRSRRRGRQASTVAAVAGTGGTIALVAAAGVPGLSAAGITSGLTAIGGTMLGGLLTVALLPAAAAALVGTAVYKSHQRRRLA
jgi:hypothetical protein